MFQHKARPLRLSLLLSFLIFSFPLSAEAPQEAEPIPTLTIRVSTRLVLVDVVVTDKHGKPVLGLQPADFAVSEKGKPQKISVFSPPSQTASKPRPPALPPGEYSNRPEYRPVALPPSFCSTPPILPKPQIKSTHALR
ncbi:MAG: hypothetical protein WBX03_16795 [Terriglobales bacterium]|jgi:hypothetical protein